MTSDQQNQAAQSQALSLQRQRWRLLHHIERLLDKPMTFLAFVWLGLLIMDFTAGLNRPLQVANNAIWVLFGLHFLLAFFIAPNKRLYLRRNWLTGLSLLLPAVRILRVFRALRVLRLARAARAVGLLRLLTSVNRSMRALVDALGRRGVGFVTGLTIIVIFAGAAGIWFFENPAALRATGQPPQGEAGLQSYSDAVWWTAMLMTTIGSDYWPRTGEGRLLTWLLSVYALAVFGYLAGTIASYFVGADRAQEEAGPQSQARRIATLQREISELRAQLAAREPPAPEE